MVENSAAAFCVYCVCAFGTVAFLGWCVIRYTLGDGD